MRNINIAAGVAATIWLIIVVIPVSFIVVSSLRDQDTYLSAGALHAPSGIDIDNYRTVLRLGFGQFLANSCVVTTAVVAMVLCTALPAAYGIVRGGSGAARFGFSLFLVGLAIPAQAVIIPIYFIVTRLSIYDSPTAIALPTAAFSLPTAIVVLTSVLRDIPRELYEAMTIDGAGQVRVFLRLVVPMSTPGLATIGIFSGLNAWNGFLFPLVLTQSTEQRVLPLGLWAFQNQYGTDVPGLMAAVVLSAAPVLLLYLIGRRHLLRGLSAGFGK